MMVVGGVVGFGKPNLTHVVTDKVSVQSMASDAASTARLVKHFVTFAHDV